MAWCWSVVAIAAIGQTLGCNKPDAEFAPAVLPKSYAFEGSVQPKYVGMWATADGSSTLSLAKDGDLKIDSVMHSVAGKTLSHLVGHWLASGDSLVFQYAVGSQPETVLKYTAALTGDTLTLKQASGRAKTTYKRK